MILDFGLAKLVDDDSDVATLTREGQFLGSLPWASPEQAAGDHAKVDMRTDVYSLGVILYRLLTGEFPYDTSGGMKVVLDRIQHDEPIPLRKVRAARPVGAAFRDAQDVSRISDRDLRTGSVSVVPVSARASHLAHIDDEIETIVLKCLAKQRERRYQTAGELARDLERYLAGEAIEAKRDSLGYVLSKQLRRYRLPVTIAAVFVTLVVIGLVVSLTLWGQASNERDRADAQGRKFQAVNRLLQATLTAVDSGELRVHEQLIRRFLDEAVGVVGPAPEDPDVRRTIGVTLAGLGEYGAAEPYLVGALEARRVVLDSGDPRIPESMVDLARLRWRQGHLVDAESLFRDVLAFWGNFPGGARAEVATASQDLAKVLQEQGRYYEADPLLRDALGAWRALFGNEHAEVAQNLDELAASHSLRSEHSEAELLLRESLRIREVLLGENHPELATTLTRLALALQAQRDARVTGQSLEMSEAETLLRQALRIRESVFGPSHPAVATSKFELASALRIRGELIEAETLYRNALEIRRRFFGDEHPETAAVLVNLGVFLQNQERLDEAEPLLREGFTVWRKLLGDTSPAVERNLNTLGWLLFRLNRFADAEVIFRDLLSLRQARRGTNDIFTLGTINDVGLMMERQGDLHGAEPYYRDALDGYRRVQGDRHQYTLAPTANLGRVLVESARFAEAVNLLEPAEEMARRTLQGQWLGDFLLSLGKARAGMRAFSTASRALEEAHRLLAEALGNTHDATQRSTLALAQLYEAWDAAEPGTGKTERAAEYRRALEASAAGGPHRRSSTPTPTTAERED